MEEATWSPLLTWYVLIPKDQRPNFSVIFTLEGFSEPFRLVTGLQLLLSQYFFFHRIIQSEWKVLMWSIRAPQIMIYPVPVNNIKMVFSIFEIVTTSISTKIGQNITNYIIFLQYNNHISWNVLTRNLFLCWK